MLPRDVINCHILKLSKLRCLLRGADSLKGSVHLDEWIYVLCYGLLDREFGRLVFQFYFCSDMVYEH